MQVDLDLDQHTGRPPTDSDYTRCCIRISKIRTPDDEHDVARNM